MLILLTVLVTQFSVAQKTPITGKVTDDGGTPLPGVNIIVKGSNSGAQTDFDGVYSLQVSEGSTLLFTYLGFADQEVTVGAQKTINVQLEPTASQLEEIVVTALGVNRDQKSLTYSAPKVSASDLTAAQNDNAVSALSGKVAGLQINSPSGNLGGSQRILIRGANSITGENQPLFIVDGIPMDNSNFNTKDAQRGSGGVDFGSSINDINPNDIESVTVLKGPAAALYGSRASNGVILIKTKSGKNSTKLGISVNSSLAFSEVAILPDLQDQYGGGSIISDAAGGRDGFNTTIIDGNEYRVVGYAVDESWGPKFDPNIQVLHWDAFDRESFPQDYLRTRPWVAPDKDVEDFFTTGVSSINTVNISSATEKGNYLFSLGNQNTTGIIPNTEINKYNAKVSLTQMLSDELTISSIINYSQTKGKRPVIGYTDNSVTQKFFQWGQRQLDYGRLRNYKNEDGTQRTWNRIGYNNPIPNYSDNPYWTIYENAPTDNRKRVFGNFSINYNIFEGVNIKGSVYGDTYRFKNTERAAIGSQAQSFYLERNYDFKEFNYELITTYQKQLSESFKMNAMVGFNKRDNENKYVKNETTGGLSLPGIFNIATGIGQLDKKATTTLKKTNSVFGSLNLSYANQLFLDFTARNDWSSSLPNDNNSYFYPSASLAWVFSDTFFSNNPSTFFNYGKLRLAWAQVGNDTTPYNVINTLSINNSFGGVGRVTVPNERLNPDLKNETTTTWEIGTELNFFQRRANLDVTYYNNETTDQIIPIDLSFGTGYGSKWVNSGKMINKGIEVSLNLTPVKTDNFEWDITLNFAKNTNELAKLPEGLNSILLANAPFRAQLAAYVGQTYGVIVGTDFVYDANGNKVITDSGAYMATDDLVPLGSVLPDYTAGLQNSLKYKNFDLGILISRSKGGSYFSTTYQWGMFTGMLEETVANNIREDGIILDGVTGDVAFNDDGTYTVTNTAPNTTRVSAQTYGGNHYGGNGTPDAQNVFDASYFKIQELTIGYNIPKNLFDFIDNARVSVFGRNLYTWGLDYKGIDPETVSGGSGNIQGLEGGLQPSVRSYGMSLQLSF